MKGTNMIENLSQLKKYLSTPGAELTMIWHKYGTPEKPAKWLNIPRGVEKLQTNAVKLQGGSWLSFDGAKYFKFEEGGFTFMQDIYTKEGLMEPTGELEELIKYTYK